MVGLLDLLMQARESGRGARADLENSINYYIPPELRGLLGFAAEANPVVSMERAGQDAQRLVQPGLSGWERMAAAGDMASNMASVLAPVAAGRAVGMPAVRALEEGLLGMSMTPEAAALRQFAGDEFGGIKAFHGSPHSFDKFSMDAIGTGEGAQAYGHGLYFADSEGVAKSYRDTLSREYSPSWRDGAGKEINIDALASNAKRGDPLSMAATALRQEKSVDDALDFFGNMRPSAFEGGEAERAEIVQGLQQFKAMGAEKKAPGSMYEVNINADPADFLDWDKPLSEQPQAVRDGLRSYLEPQYGEGLFDEYAASGNGLRDLYANFDDLTPAAMSEELAKRGIPGIKYLDAGSRGAGDGSRNYVVFDENLIDIVRKYGIAGAAAMLGASQADVAQAMQQQRPQGLLSGPQ